MPKMIYPLFLLQGGVLCDTSIGNLLVCLEVKFTALRVLEGFLEKSEESRPCTFKNICCTMEDFSKLDPPFKSTVTSVGKKIYFGPNRILFALAKLSESNNEY